MIVFLTAEIQLLKAYEDRKTENEFTYAYQAVDMFVYEDFSRKLGRQIKT